MAREDVTWALDALRAEPRRTHRKLAWDYYRGDHRLAFASEKFRSTFGKRLTEYADNLCPAVIDAIGDRLNVTGFAFTGEDDEEAEALAREAWTIWERNRMDLRSSDVHRESLLTGDGYAIVWPDEAGAAAIWPQVSHEMVVHYDPETPGLIDRAAKVWEDDERRMRVTLYYPERLEKYRSVRSVRDGLPSRMTWRDFDDFLPPETGTGQSFETDGSVENPWGRVPVFHFPNRRLYAPGVGELLDVVPLQDALNKAGADKLVAMEFASFRQRWVTGLPETEVPDEGVSKPPPFKHGVDTIFASTDPNTTFGQFEATDLSQFLEVEEGLRAEIARVSGTPLHYLFITRGDFPSGEAMKSAEARFTKKLTDRQTAHGNTWEDVLCFSLKIEGEDVGPEQATTLWEDASPVSERERMETLLMKKTLGYPLKELLIEAGLDADEAGAAAETASAAAEAAEKADTILPVANGRMGVPAAQT